MTATQPTSIWIDPDLLKVLDEQAKKEGRSRNNLIVRILGLYLAQGK